MRGELAVRIFDGTTDRHVTQHVSDLRFTKTAPGGHLAASMRLSLPRDTFDDLGPADKCWIYDATTGRPLWEGFTQNPGATDGPAGQGFDLSAIGTTVLTTDESRALVYIDKDLTKWERYSGGLAAATVENTADPTGVDTGDGVLLQFNPAQTVGTGQFVQVGYNHLRGAGLELGAFQWSFKSGKADANYNVAYVQRGGTPATNIVQGTLSTTLATLGRYVNGGAGHFDTGTDAVALDLSRDGGATTIGGTDDSTWTWFTELFILMRRMNKFGTLVTGSGGMVSSSSVLASQVVEDLLGRVLTFCDKNASTVEATTFLINQLAYYDAVNVRKVLDDLAGLEPDFLSEMLHSTPSGYVFNYRAWPTEARYEISTADGYSKTGGDVDLCNRIAVTWIDERGRSQVETVTTVVPALDDQGRIRDAEPVTLTKGRGSQENAQRYGEQVLAAKNEGPKAATARVGRRIKDHLRGTWAEPWEIEPGYMASVRETGDLLRLTQMEYVDADGAAMLQLGLPTPTVDERVARAAINLSKDGRQY